MVDLRIGDCLEVMRGMASNSIDAVVTDPPYGQSNESYDRGVPSEVWAECFRVCKPNAALISFAGSPTYHRIASGIESAGWRVRQMWGWIYRDGMITSAWPKEGFDRLAPAFDPICYATKGKFLLDVTRIGDPWEATRNTAGYSQRAALCLTKKASGHYPRTLVADDTPGFEYFVLGRTSHAARKEGTGHPNRKPVALMEWLVSKTPKDIVILDPFMGSGTTGVACLNTGRHFIGIEKDADYFETARDRIDSELSKTALLPA